MLEKSSASPLLAVFISLLLAAPALAGAANSKTDETGATDGKLYALRQPLALALPTALPTAESGLSELLAQPLPQPRRRGLEILLPVTNPDDPAVLAAASQAASLAERAGWGVGFWWNAAVPSPALDHETLVSAQVEALRGLLAAHAGNLRTLIIDWQAPERPTAADYAFLLKRLSVTARGAAASVRVVGLPLSRVDLPFLRELADFSLPAYWDLATADSMDAAGLAEMGAILDGFDPGRGIALVTELSPASPENPPVPAPLAWARSIDLGARLTILRLPDSGATLGLVAPLARAAEHLAGDIAPSAQSPRVFGTGDAILAAETHVYLRAEDLATLLIVGPSPAGARALELSGTEYKNPRLTSATSGRGFTPQAGARPGGKYVVGLSADGGTDLVSLARPTPEELNQQRETVNVAAERGLSAEEIIAKHQTFQSSHDARLENFTAVNKTSMRFRVGEVRQTFESSIWGKWLYANGEGFEWVWEEFFVNGVKWRGKRPPELPLLQPEKVTTLPLAINFGADYQYVLAGEEEIDGFAAYVLDFEPEEVAAGAGYPKDLPLYRGRLWIDKEHFARLRSTAVQLNLTGEVISNEEISEYRPALRLSGSQPTTPLTAPEWRRATAGGGARIENLFWLPVLVRGEQIFATAGRSTAVERRSELSEFFVNRADFAAVRAAARASDSSIVKDTERGMRYFSKGEDGERHIKEDIEKSQTFAAAGGFYDDSLDYPLPFLGINYFNFDLAGKGYQTNVFFALALATATISDPSFLGSPFDVGADLFAIAIPFGDTVYSNGVEIEDQKINDLPANLALHAGHPLGNFGKATLTYNLHFDNFQRHEDTASAFVIPENTLTHTAELALQYTRRGYGANVSADYSTRDRWDFWGMPGNADYDPEAKTFVKWQAGLSKDFFLPYFQKLHLSVSYRDSERTDRFSKYALGFFGGNAVHGFKNNSVRAETLALAHFSYGFNVANVVRLEGFYDSAWAKDEAAGLDWEQLQGAGIGGTLMGPWSTIINFDAGYPLTKGIDGYVVNLVILKLF